MRRILVLAFAVVALGACKSKVEKAYETCVERQTEKLVRAAESGPAQLQASVKSEAPRVAAATCGPIKSFCAQDEDTAMCRQMMEKLGGEKDG